MYSKLLIIFLVFFNTINAQPIQNKTNVQFKKIAGIEVGSKGVKLTVLEKNLANENDINVLKDTAINTDFISFTSTSYDATLNAFTFLYNYVIVNWKIPSSDIATVISSGVKAQADKLKKQSHLNTFIDAFRIRINEDNKEVEVVDVLKESIFSHYGIVANDNRHNTFLIDIGSGNTKGGYFKKNTNDFVMFQIPSGTKSTFNLVEKKLGANIDFVTFNKGINPIVDSLEKSEIIYAVNASGAYPSTTTMAMSGGIVWAVATLLKPEKTESTFLDVTYKEIVKFRENLIKFEKDIPDTNKIMVKGITQFQLSKIRIEVSRVVKVFDTKSLLAGSSLMLKIMRQFEATNASKKFKLIKNGQVGWITGYILNKGGINKMN
jgi:hypothetical protein